MVHESQLNPPKKAIAGKNFSVFWNADFSRSLLKNSMTAKYKKIGEHVDGSRLITYMQRMQQKKKAVFAKIALKSFIRPKQTILQVLQKGEYNEKDHFVAFGDNTIFIRRNIHLAFSHS